MRIRLISLLFAILLMPGVRAVHGQDERTRLTGKVDLVRIVDLACQKRGVDVRYDPQEIRGSVTIRSTTGLTDDELWDLMQRALAKEGLTTIYEPGDAQLRIVQLADARAAARLDLDGVAPEEAGYVTVLLEIVNAPVDDVVSAVKPLLSKPGGDIKRIGKDGDLVLLSELQARLAQALAVIQIVDAPRAEPIIRKIRPQYLRPAALMPQIGLATKAREALTGRPLTGAVIPMLDGSALLLVAPASEVAVWEQLVAEFDVPQQVTTETYRPRSFTLDDVAALIEETTRVEGPHGSGDAWKVVRDTLTDSLVITATVSEHEGIRELLGRLDAQVAKDGGARTVIRRIKIRNRNLTDLHDTLDGMLDAGMITDVPRAQGGGRGERGRSDPASRTSPIAPRDVIMETPRAGETSRRAAASGPPESLVRVSGAGDVTITTDTVTSSLILMGPPRLVDELEQLVAELDVREPQVMLEVMVVTLNDSEMLDLGVELNKIELSGSTIIDLASVFGLSALGAGDMDTSMAERGQGFNGLILNPGDFSVVIRALQSISNGRTLVTPKVLVNNGEQAILDAVQRVPVQSTNASSTVATTAFSGTVDAGTQLTLTPQIAEGDHLLLEYDISLSTFVGDSADPSLPPPRQENSLASLVTVPDGHTIVLGGLETTSEAEAVSQVPFLGDLPIIGELFKSRSTTDSISRFFVFVRPTILRHDGFEDLRYLSERDRVVDGIDDGWPEVEPRVIR